MRLLCSCIQLTSSQELKHECSWATYVNRKWGHFHDRDDYSEVWAKALPKNSKCPLPVGLSCSKTPLLKLPILHFHISHNTPCLPPKHFAQGLSFISLGTTVMTSRYKKQKLCKVLWGQTRCIVGDVRVANWPAGTRVITFHQEVVCRWKITPTPLSLYKRRKLFSVVTDLHYKYRKD